MSNSSLPELFGEVTADSIRHLESKYYTQMRACQVDPRTQLEYARLLVRSRYPADMQKGLLFLEQLARLRCWSRRETRDVVVQLAVGWARMRDYPLALALVRRCRVFSPEDDFARRLERAICKKLQREAVRDLIFAGAVLLISLLGCLTAGAATRCHS